MARIEAGKETETLELLNEFYKSYNPGFPLDYTFLDEDYQRQYVSEQRVSTLSRYFAGLAIVISCPGLFGFAAFTAGGKLKAALHDLTRGRWKTYTFIVASGCAIFAIRTTSKHLTMCHTCN